MIILTSRMKRRWSKKYTEENVSFLSFHLIDLGLKKGNYAHAYYASGWKTRRGEKALSNYKYAMYSVDLAKSKNHYDSYNEAQVEENLRILEEETKKIQNFKEMPFYKRLFFRLIW